MFLVIGITIVDIARVKRLREFHTKFGRKSRNIALSTSIQTWIGKCRIRNYVKERIHQLILRNRFWIQFDPHVIHIIGNRYYRIEKGVERLFKHRFLLFRQLRRRRSARFRSSPGNIRLNTRIVGTCRPKGSQSRQDYFTHTLHLKPPSPWSAGTVANSSDKPYRIPFPWLRWQPPDAGALQVSAQATCT